MNKQILLIALLALVCSAGQAKVYKKIKAPVAMSCVNVHNGELKAREVIMTDTATTVHFTIEYPKGEIFRFASESYLMDEDGIRYPLRSAENIAPDTWITSPENGITNFTMHFEPLPKGTKMFDYIECDIYGAFMLLGIHDKKLKVKTPTFQELSDANPYTVPADWFTTDTITIRGRIEGYDAEKFGFTSMECYYEDVFEKDDATLVLDIAADGSFEKKFQASYPIRHNFRTQVSNVGFATIPFFARPGETIDITVKPNESGRYECFYNSGSSKDVERWLKSSLDLWDIAYPLHMFKGKFSEVGEMTERTWQNMLYRLQMESRRLHFTPQEMQLALANLQVNFTYAVMDYVMYHGDEQIKQNQRDGVYFAEIVDSVEYNEIRKLENYKALHRVNFDNPMMLVNKNFPITVNRIQFTRPVREKEYEGLIDENGVVEQNMDNEKKKLYNSLSAYRELMGADHDNLMAQICTYKFLLSYFNYWRSNEEKIPKILADTTMTVAEREEDVASIQTLSKMMPLYLDVFSNPYIHQKAELFYAYKMAQTELATPLPDDNPSADLIRSLCAKYPGRFLVIDFWGMGCGPCRSEIQNSKTLRAEIAKRDDVKLVFIAGESTPGGSDAYKKYVAEWLADEEAICISHNDFTRFEELFRFNGIPHYETITPDCRRVRDDLQVSGYYNFNGELKRVMDKLK